MKKQKIYLTAASVRLPPQTLVEIEALAKEEGKTRSSMVNYLVEIGIEGYKKGGAKDLAILRGKLKEIRDIVER